MSVFLSELNDMRSKYAPPKRCFLKKPEWLKRTDRLNSIFEDCEKLFKKGQIYYAALVQANDILFEYFPHNDAPASFVYSTDPYFEENPDELCSVASNLFDYKYKDPEDIPEDYRAIAAAIADEYDRTKFSFEVNIDGGLRKLVFVTTIVFRRHIPRGKLMAPILPVLAAPEHSDNVIILPKKFWTKSFKKLYTST